MRKLDLRKELRYLYQPTAKEPQIVDVPRMRFAAVDGRGNPNTSQDFHDALEALFALSYTAKFAIKKAGVADYPVLPLEALWWTDADGRFRMDAKEEWKWTAMIMQPEVVTREWFEKVVDQVRAKRSPRALSKVRLQPFREGLSAQILHIGPYAEERPTIERLHRFIEEKGYQAAGKHHEIYLGDPRRSAPKKLKTVLRQPMRE